MTDYLKMQFPPKLSEWELSGGALQKVRRMLKMLPLYQNWPLALIDRLHLLSRRPVVYHLRNGIRLSLEARPFDVRLINEIWIDRIYTRWPGFTIGDGWIVADLGGQKGVFSVLAATSARDVKVFAFEPAPESFASFVRNLELNALSNVKVFNVAVTSMDGEAILHLSTESANNSLMERPGIIARGDAKVEAWSMASVLRRLPAPINLLKMDIEGMEYDALFSCSTDDLKKVERIALEYHDAHFRTGCNKSDLVQFLNAKGFSTSLVSERPILLAARRDCLTTKTDCTFHG